MIRAVTSILLVVLFCYVSVMPAHSGLQDNGKSEDSDLRENEEVEGSYTAEEHFNQGRTYLVQGNEVKASEAFDMAVSIDKSFSARVPDEYYIAGLILIKDPRKSNIGIHYLNKYLSDKPDKGKELAAIFYEEGFKMVVMNKFMAHVILENAMKLNPLYENDEQFYLAYSVRSANKAADMIKGGELFIRRFPQSIHIPEVMYLTGDAYFEMRKIPEARDYFKKVKDRFPDSECGKNGARRL